MPSTVFAASAAAVKTIEFCRVWMKMLLRSSLAKLSRPTKWPLSPTRASLRLNHSDSTNG